MAINPIFSQSVPEQFTDQHFRHFFGTFIFASISSKLSELKELSSHFAQELRKRGINIAQFDGTLEIAVLSCISSRATQQRTERMKIRDLWIAFALSPLQFPSTVTEYLTSASIAACHDGNEFLTVIFSDR